MFYCFCSSLILCAYKLFIYLLTPASHPVLVHRNHVRCFSWVEWTVHALVSWNTDQWGSLRWRSRHVCHSSSVWAPRGPGCACLSVSVESVSRQSSISSCCATGASAATGAQARGFEQVGQWASPASMLGVPRCPYGLWVSSMRCIFLSHLWRAQWHTCVYSAHYLVQSLWKWNAEDSCTSWSTGAVWLLSVLHSSRAVRTLLTIKIHMEKTNTG